MPKDDNIQQATGALNAAVSAQQKFIADVLSEKPDQVYRLDDYDTIRHNLFNNVADAVKRRFPLVNSRYTLSVEDVDYDDPEELDVDEQKRALLSGKSCTRRLRGAWVLTDNATGKEISRTRRMTLMRVPHMTDRGTFIRNGREYAFTNIMRLEPGVYTKSKPDEVSAQFNVKKGTGQGFTMRMLPSSGLFQITRGTATAPAYTVLKDMGVTDDQMKEAWGDELFARNREAGLGQRARQAADRIYSGK